MSAVGLRTIICISVCVVHPCVGLSWTKREVCVHLHARPSVYGCYISAWTETSFTSIPAPWNMIQPSKIVLCSRLSPLVLCMAEPTHGAYVSFAWWKTHSSWSTASWILMESAVAVRVSLCTYTHHCDCLNCSHASAQRSFVWLSLITAKYRCNIGRAPLPQLLLLKGHWYKRFWEESSCSLCGREINLAGDWEHFITTLDTKNQWKFWWTLHIFKVSCDPLSGQQTGSGIY